MTDLREAAQMALDALDKLLDKLNADICDNSGIWDEYCDGGNAMQALSAALAQPEQEPEPYCYTWDVWISGGYWEARYGWEPYCGGKRPAHSTEAKPLYTAPPQREWCQCKDAPNDCTYENNCRVPQIDAAFKRIEWQGLTDEEIDAAVKSCNTVDTYKYFRAIEAKLKEKNS